MRNIAQWFFRRKAADIRSYRTRHYNKSVYGIDEITGQQTVPRPPFMRDDIIRDGHGFGMPVAFSQPKDRAHRRAHKRKPEAGDDQVRRFPAQAAADFPPVEWADRIHNRQYLQPFRRRAVSVLSLARKQKGRVLQAKRIYPDTITLILKFLCQSFSRGSDPAPQGVRRRKKNDSFQFFGQR